VVQAVLDVAEQIQMGRLMNKRKTPVDLVMEKEQNAYLKLHLFILLLLLLSPFDYHPQIAYVVEVCAVTDRPDRAYW